MSTKPSSPELRPNRYDALVVLVVLALAAVLAVRPFLAARAPQRGALTVRRQKWQPCRAGKFCQRRGPRGRKHLGIKSVDIAFECLQHKTVPSVDLKFFTELLYVPPAAEPAES